jgi:hypothetical protein
MFPVLIAFVSVMYLFQYKKFTYEFGWMPFQTPSTAHPSFGWKDATSGVTIMNLGGVVPVY